MIVPIKRSDKEWEWVFVELQGNIKNRISNVLNDECFGAIAFTESHTAVLLIGQYVIVGKETILPKPFAILEKKSDLINGDMQNEKSSEQHEYIVKAIVRKKLSFKGRPRFAVSNAPRIK